jgi:hypothetical protein
MGGTPAGPNRVCSDINFTYGVVGVIDIKAFRYIGKNGLSILKIIKRKKV